MSKESASFVLQHPCGLRVESNLRQSEAMTVSAVVPRDMHTGYVWYDLPEAVISDQRILMSLCFFQQALDSIILSVVDEKFGTSWADWNESKQRARTEATRQWLATVGYPVGTYSWGIVWAEYDPRSGGGHGGIRFKRNAT